MSKKLNDLSKYKQVLRNLLGDRYATWIHASRFAYLLSFTDKLYKEIDFQLLEHFSLRESVVVDVGANSANWTIVLSKQVGRNGKVYAFEADPYYADVTEKTIKLFGIKNVLFFSFGLSDKPDVLPLKILDNGIRVAGTSHFVSNKSDHGVTLVQVYPLDTLIDSHPSLLKTSFIKCDVEGFESRVFRGAKRILETARPVVVSEMNQDSQENTKEVFNLFKTLNYKSYVVVTENSIRLSESPGRIPEGERPNRIFIPKEYIIPDTIRVVE